MRTYKIYLLLLWQPHKILAYFYVKFGKSLDFKAILC